MMDTMEKRKKKLELELLRGILGAIEADIDLEHDFSELLRFHIGGVDIDSCQIECPLQPLEIGRAHV